MHIFSQPSEFQHPCTGLMFTTCLHPYLIGRGLVTSEMQRLVRLRCIWTGRFVFLAHGEIIVQPRARDHPMTWEKLVHTCILKCVKYQHSNCGFLLCHRFAFSLCLALRTIQWEGCLCALQKYCNYPATQEHGSPWG